MGTAGLSRVQQVSGKPEVIKALPERVGTQQGHRVGRWKSTTFLCPDSERAETHVRNWRDATQLRVVDTARRGGTHDHSQGSGP